MSMDRRKFLQTGAASLAALTWKSQLFSQGQSSPPPPPPKPGRQVHSLNRNWRFSAKRFDGDTKRDFNDAAFESVTIPHTNKRLPWHSFDDKSYEFVSIYRRRFMLPGSNRGKHVFVDFEGAMTAATVWINGHNLGEYKGGYTPFSFELTRNLYWDHENVLAVELDSTERKDIPPFGGSIDYLTFGGIYRDVRLRFVPATHIENVFAWPKDALSDKPSVEISCSIARLEPEWVPHTLEVELRDGDKVLATARKELPKAPPSPEPVVEKLTVADFGPVERWDLDKPKLYTVVVRLKMGNTVMDEDRRRIGFREARFTDHGFELNGRIVKLRGLNHHQTFPYVGQAMPARAQRRDAYILKKELKVYIVRTSHYPQSPHFLDACDELGLLVLEEIPGWQHIGDQAWQDLAVDNVRRMIRRDWNHPSIILWGVRINESRDNHDFYTRTNSLAHELDPSRQTGGIRYFQESEFLEDVFTMNDFNYPPDKMRAPNHPLYLNTEFVGHTFVTKPYDSVERLTEHLVHHAAIHNHLGSNPQYAGGIGWCAFDYNTHSNFGSGDRVCYHGVTDIFRLPKPAAHFYKSQCDPAEEIVLEPAFTWSARGDWTGTNGDLLVSSNCDHLKFFIGDRLVAEADPNRTDYAFLPHPPFKINLNRAPWGDLRIEGYLADKKVIEKMYAVDGVDKKLLVVADDAELKADGADSTRVSFFITDEYGNLRRYTSGSVSFKLEGPAEIIGENPFSLVGGAGAIWIRAKHLPGAVVLRATHAALGTQEVKLQIKPAERDLI